MPIGGSVPDGVGLVQETHSEVLYRAAFPQMGLTTPFPGTSGAPPARRHLQVKTRPVA